MQETQAESNNPQIFRFVKKFKPKDETLALFVGGIRCNSLHSSINKIFKSFGKITRIVLIRTNRGTSKGYCFVEFESQHSVQKVLNHGNLFLGKRKLNCRKILKGNDLKNSKRSLDKRRVYCDKIPQNLDEIGERQLRQLFEKFGEIENLYFSRIKNLTSKKFKIAHVVFQRISSAKSAVGNIVEFMGEELLIKVFKRRIFKEGLSERIRLKAAGREYNNGIMASDTSEWKQSTRITPKEKDTKFLVKILEHQITSVLLVLPKSQINAIS
jgi:RNA recognition motif-containing protein